MISFVRSFHDFVPLFVYVLCLIARSFLIMFVLSDGVRTFHCFVRSFLISFVRSMIWFARAMFVPSFHDCNFAPSFHDYYLFPSSHDCDFVRLFHSYDFVTSCHDFHCVPSFHDYDFVRSYIPSLVRSMILIVQDAYASLELALLKMCK